MEGTDSVEITGIDPRNTVGILDRPIFRVDFWHPIDSGGVDDL